MESEILNLLSSLHPEFDYSQSNNFIEDGMLDSFDIVNIVSELENNFNIIIDGLEILPENFANTKTILELVNRSEKQ